MWRIPRSEARKPGSLPSAHKNCMAFSAYMREETAQMDTYVREETAEMASEKKWHLTLHRNFSMFRALAQRREASYLPRAAGAKLGQPVTFRSALRAVSFPSTSD